MNLAKLKRMSALDAYETVEEEWKKEKNRSDLPADLNLSEILVLPQIFQQRQFGPSSDNQSLESRDHVKRLSNFLNKHPEKDLPAVSVLPVGGHFILIDGHHRVEAYKDRTQGFQVVPVEVFRGTFEEAVDKSLESNIHTKLPMTKEDISEAAWRIVRLGKVKPLSAIEQRVDVGIATIKRMSARKKLISGDGSDPFEFTWKQAWQYNRKKEWDEDQMDKDAEEAALKIRSAIRPSFIDNPMMMKTIIEKLSSALDDGLAQIYNDDDWIVDDDE